MTDKNNQDPNKKIDESWKEAVEKEKVDEPCSHKEGEPYSHGDTGQLQATFTLFITGLAMEALIALGEIENPITKKKDSHPAHAKFIIDTLSMLKEKTKNNLAKEEAEALESILYDLRMRFLNKKGAS